MENVICANCKHWEKYPHGDGVHGECYNEESPYYEEMVEYDDDCEQGEEE